MAYNKSSLTVVGHSGLAQGMLMSAESAYPRDTVAVFVTALMLSNNNNT
jgi:hypothetical protein